MSKPCCVEWDDAELHTEWFSPGDVQELKPPRIKTYGLLVRNDSKAIVLAGSENGGKYGDCTIIPKALIRKVTRLK